MAQKRYKQILGEWLTLFDSISVNFMGELFVEINLLVTEMDKFMAQYDPDIKEKIFWIMKYDGSKIISKEDFISIM